MDKKGRFDLSATLMKVYRRAALYGFNMGCVAQPSRDRPATVPRPSRNRSSAVPQPSRNPFRKLPATIPQPPRNRPATVPQPSRNRPATRSASVPQPSRDRPAIVPQPSRNRPQLSRNPFRKRPASGKVDGNETTIFILLKMVLGFRNHGLEMVLPLEQIVNLFALAQHAVACKVFPNELQFADHDWKYGQML
jgi:hypothetical protein